MPLSGTGALAQWRRELAMGKRTPDSARENCADTGPASWPAVVLARDESEIIVAYARREELLASARTAKPAKRGESV
ncbi:MAG: hypothetical protein ACR2OG_08410 [Gemmatimonadaceae bacterium]